MSKKLVFVSCLLVVMSLASTSMAELAAYYGMKEGAGTTVTDGSGKGHDGTLVGTPTWVEGSPGNGTGVQFGTTGSTVINCGQWDTTAGTNMFTVACWVKFATGGAQYQGLIVNRDNSGSQNWGVEVMGASGSFYFGGSASAYGLGTFTAGTWTHFALSSDGATTRIYLNGALTRTTTTPRLGTVKNSMVRIGSSEPPGNVFQGVIDEVYIFSGELLTVEQVTAVMNGDMQPAGTPGLPKLPEPANKKTEVSIDVGGISWKAGEYANTHNVFFGTNFDDVNEATIANPLGATVYAGLPLDSNRVDLARLEYGTTYYWRVDEVNVPSKPATITGLVWSFKTELKGYPLAAASIIKVTASDNCAYPGEQEPNFTSKGLGLDANSAHSDNYKHMWLGIAEELGQIWIQYEFDKVYKLNDMLVWNYNEPNPGESYGAKDVNIAYSLDGVTWQALGGTVQFNQATGLPNYKANTTIDFDGAIAKYVKLTFWSAWDESNILGGVSEVKFSAMPTRVQTPVPATAAANIAVNQVLGWRAGRGVDTHKLYIGTDSNSVRDGLVTAVDIDSVSYAPVLELSRTYYWRVDEVNMAEAYTTWDGPVWSFTTVGIVVVDNFQVGYDDSDANAVWATWTGWEDTTNGGAMGNPGTPYLSSTITYNGNRAAPFFYDNSTKTYSEAKAQVAELPIVTSDWTKGAPTSLVIWFRGDPNNTQAQLYAKLNNSKVLYDGDPIQLTQTLWRPWVIELSKFNINMSNVTSIAIGLDRTVTPAVKSVLYVDYITLYRVAPPVAAAPVNPGNTDLIARYSMENNVLDSSGNGRNGTIISNPLYVPSLSGYGMAMDFNGVSDCVDLGLSDPNTKFNPAGSFSVSLWAKIRNWSTAWGHTMVSNRGEGTVGWQIRRAGGTNLSFTTRGISNDDMTSTAATPPLNDWVHITCVYDSVARTKSIYMNGLLDRTVNMTGAVIKIPATTHNTYIGTRANSGNTGRESYFTGMIDEVRMYNRALSAGEAAFLGDPTP